jgi:hypothetical protein
LNGNSEPAQNYTVAGIAGFIAFLVIFTLLKFTFHL